MLDISLNDMMYVCISLFAFISKNKGKRMWAMIKKNESGMKSRCELKCSHSVFLSVASLLLPKHTDRQRFMFPF